DVFSLADRADFLAREHGSWSEASLVKIAQGRGRHHSRVMSIAHHLMDRAGDLTAIALISLLRHLRSPQALQKSPVALALCHSTPTLQPLHSSTAPSPFWKY